MTGGTTPQGPTGRCCEQLWNEDIDNGGTNDPTPVPAQTRAGWGAKEGQPGGWGQLAPADRGLTTPLLPRRHSRMATPMSRPFDLIHLAPKRASSPRRLAASTSTNGAALLLPRDADHDTDPRKLTTPTRPLWECAFSSRRNVADRRLVTAGGHATVLARLEPVRAGEPPNDRKIIRAVDARCGKPPRQRG